jgi:hypothetical protein
MSLSELGNKATKSSDAAPHQLNNGHGPSKSRAPSDESRATVHSTAASRAREKPPTESPGLRRRPPETGKKRKILYSSLNIYYFLYKNKLKSNKYLKIERIQQKRRGRRSQSAKRWSRHVSAAVIFPRPPPTPLK